MHGFVFHRCDVRADGNGTQIVEAGGCRPLADIRDDRAEVAQHFEAGCLIGTRRTATEVSATARPCR